MKYRLTLAVLAAGSITLSSCSSSGSGGGGGDDLILGVMISRTGPVAAVTGGYDRAAQAWAASTNANGGLNGHDVKLEFCDDASVPDKATQCGRQLARDADVVVLAGAAGQNLAAIQQLKSKIVINLSPNILPASNSQVFTATPGIPLMLSTLFKFAVDKLHVKNVGILATTDASGQATIDGASAAAKPLGVSLTEVRLDPTTVDPSSQLTKLQGSNVGLIYVSYTGAGAATVVKAAHNLNLTIPMTFNLASGSTEFLKSIQGFRPEVIYHLAPSAAIVPSLVPAKYRSGIQDFLDSFQKEEGQPADANAVAATYVMDTAGLALTEVSKDGIPAAIKALKADTVHSLTDIKLDPSSGTNVFTGFYPAVIASKPDGTFVAP